MEASQRIDVLRNTQSIAQRLQKLVPSRTLAQPSNFLYPPIPTLDLPDSLDLTTLNELSLPASVHCRILSKINDAVQALKNQHTAKYHDNCKELLAIHRPEDLPNLLHKVRQTYKASYVDHFLPMIWEKIADTLQQLQPSRSNCEEKIIAKMPFNNAYTPMLEVYFELNAYPNAGDRKRLARKSMMTVRQIDVWFQNHRRRAKKEGRHLRRLPDGSPTPSLDLDSKIPASPSQVLPAAVTCRSSVDISSDEDEHILPVLPGLQPPITSPNPLINVLSSSHAYPTPYSQSSRSRIFSLKYDGEGYEFHPPTPEWMRRPATASSLSPMDFAEFINHFDSKLDLRKGVTEKPKNFQRQESWFAHRYTIASQAPLPSLIQTPPYSLPDLHLPVGIKGYSSQVIPPGEALTSKGPWRSKSTHKFASFSSRNRIPRSSPLPSASTSRSSSFSSSYSPRTQSGSSNSSSSLPSTPSTSPLLSPLALPQPTNLSETLPEFALQDQIFQSLYGSMPTLDPIFTDFPLKPQHASLSSRHLSPVYS